MEQRRGFAPRSELSVFLVMGGESHAFPVLRRFTKRGHRRFRDVPKYFILLASAASAMNNRENDFRTPVYD